MTTQQQRTYLLKNKSSLFCPIASVILLIITILLIGGCFSASSTLAPVTDYGKNYGAGSAGIHTVNSGETLWDISKRYKLPMRDIIAVNDLSPPYYLDINQRLKLPPPREYKVKAGDSIYAISRLFGVSSSEITSLNNINSPYIITEGQIIRLPSQAGSTEQQNNKYGTSVTVNSRKTANKPPAKISKYTSPTPKRSSGKFASPLKGKIISSYGAKQNGLHNDGINISAPKGTPVRSAENGVVVYSDNKLKGYGNLVLVRHDGGWMTAYAHLDKILVKKNQKINVGETIGTVGSTGSVTSPQLHFEIRKGTKAVNPQNYM